VSARFVIDCLFWIEIRLWFVFWLSRARVSVQRGVGVRCAESRRTGGLRKADKKKEGIVVDRTYAVREFLVRTNSGRKREEMEGYLCVS